MQNCSATFAPTSVIPTSLTVERTVEARSVRWTIVRPNYSSSSFPFINEADMRNVIYMRVRIKHIKHVKHKKTVES